MSEEINIERKLTRTSGGVYLRIPKDIVEAYDIQGKEFVKATIEVRLDDTIG